MTTESRPRLARSDLLWAILAAFAAAIVGAAAWWLASQVHEIVAAIVAVGVGTLVGFATLEGARGQATIGAVVIAMILTILANAGGQNFVQRSMLLEGIERLQQDWAGLHVDKPPETEEGRAMTSEEAVAEAEEQGLSCDLIPEGVIIPPPEIVAVMPVGGFLCMDTQDIAVIWQDIPDEVRAEFPEDIRAEVEEIVTGQTAEDLAARRAEYESQAYDIPDAVVACAPIPDFTQETAAAGLGFTDGVPLFLPAADLFSGDRVRGDGLVIEPASPLCFMRENAKEHPLEAASWLVALGVAGGIPFVRRRRQLAGS